jgi:type IV pilus assembly protein PilM
MALLGRKKTTIGLDVGSGLVKVVVMDHSRSVPEVVRVAIVPLLADAIVEGEVMDPGVVADAIRAALDAVGSPNGTIVTAVGGRDVIVKKIQMERVREQQAREFMRLEAEQHVPFDMESVQVDFQIMDPDDDAPEMSVLLVAAKQDLVDAKLRLLGDADVAATIVDVDAFALHNAFERSHPDAMRGVVALVNVGHEVTNINILHHGIPILTRDIGVGTRRFREELQRDHGMSADDAEALVQGNACTPQLDHVVAMRGEEISVGLERAAAFLASSMRSVGAITAVYVCGGGARIPGLLDALADRLRVRVDAANPLANLAVREDALELLIADEVAPLLMLPIGLALRQPV